MATWTSTVRETAAGGLHRLRADWLRVVEATVAASIAWLVAVKLLHHPQPFFAPATALIVLGVTLGKRWQRATEIVVGVAVGVLLADLITRAIGPHTIGAVVVVLLLTLTAGVLLGGGPILAVQATVSAVYVAVVAPDTNVLGFARFQDALVGGSVALVINLLPLHRDPLRQVLADAGTVLQALSTVLVDIAAALDTHDRDAAQEALEQARAADADVAAFRASLGIGQEVFRTDPLRRLRRAEMPGRSRGAELPDRSRPADPPGHSRPADPPGRPRPAEPSGRPRHAEPPGRGRRSDALNWYEEMVRQIDYAVRNVRVLARNVVAVTRGPEVTPPALGDAIRELARAVTALAVDVGNPAAKGAQDSTTENLVLERALAAVRCAATAQAPGMPLPVLGIVWQIRSTAVDLLRGTGLELATVLELTDDALGG